MLFDDLRRYFCSSLVCCSALALTAACAQLPSPYATATEQQAVLRDGGVTSRALVQSSLRRIHDLDRNGPTLNSVIALNPQAVADAESLDRERRDGRVRGPLHGITIIIKDNIEADGDMATTAGSLALRANVTRRDAPIVKQLRQAGGVILGKANLSEWANYRSTRSVSGWSGIGGLTRNPYGLDRSACGSSSGTAVAVAAGLATVGLGSETDGSIICPASASGVVGFKPTLGLVSRTHIVPLTPEQDTAGPITRSVADAAAVLTAIAGTDQTDPATREADAHKVDYLAALDVNALKGARIGVLRGATTPLPPTDVLFARALATLRSAGAILVDVKSLDEVQATALSRAKGDASKAEFRVAINEYLATTPPAVTTRTLDDLIKFNAATPRETALFGQEIFESAAAARPLTDPEYLEQRATAKRLAGPEGLDAMMRGAEVEAIISQTTSPAAVVDPLGSARFLGSPSTLPAVAGYPHLTVPMGEVTGLPVGLSFIGPKWSDARVLSLGYAFEQLTHARRAPTFPTSVNVRAEVAAAYESYESK